MESFTILSIPSMVQTKRPPKTKSKYLTPDTPAGEKALKYIYNICEKALDYCQQQEITNFEDFAEVIEIISQQEAEKRNNDKLEIAVTVTEGGMSLRLPNTNLGSTTGAYMMQHLGFDEDETKKFTRHGVENSLNPQRDDEFGINEDEFSFDETETSKSRQFKKTRQANSNSTQLEDLLESALSDSISTETPSKPSSLSTTSRQNKSQKPPNQSKQNSQQSPPRQTTISQRPTSRTNSFELIDKLLNSVATTGEKMVEQTNDIDGLALGGLLTSTSAITALIGEKALANLIKIAQENGKMKQLAKTLNRIQAIYERTNQLDKRAEVLTQNSESLEEEANNSQIKQFDNSPEQLPEKNPSHPFAEILTKLSQKIDKTSQSIPEDTPNNSNPSKLSQKDSSVIPTIDPKASFEEQLHQINAALEHLEQRLDELEQRLERLEQLVQSNLNLTQSPPSDISIDKESFNPNATLLYFDGVSTPGQVAGASVLVLPNGQTYTVTLPMNQATNNEAEYMGLIAGLEKAQELGLSELEIKGDSQLVVNQMKGEYQVKSDNLLPLHQQATSLLNEFESVNLTCIKRDENHLANQAANDCIAQGNNYTKAILPSQQICHNLLLIQTAFNQTEAPLPLNEHLTLSVDNKFHFHDEKTEQGVKFNRLNAVLIEDETGTTVFSATQRINGDWRIDIDQLNEQTKQDIEQISLQVINSLSPSVEAESKTPQKEESVNIKSREADLAQDCATALLIIHNQAEQFGEITDLDSGLPIGDEAILYLDKNAEETSYIVSLEHLDSTELFGASYDPDNNRWTIENDHLTPEDKQQLIILSQEIIANQDQQIKTSTSVSVFEAESKNEETNADFELEA